MDVLFFLLISLAKTKADTYQQHANICNMPTYMQHANIDHLKELQIGGGIEIKQAALHSARRSSKEQRFIRAKVTLFIYKIGTDDFDDRRIIP